MVGRTTNKKNKQQTAAFSKASSTTNTNTRKPPRPRRRKRQAKRQPATMSLAKPKEAHSRDERRVVESLACAKLCPSMSDAPYIVCDEDELTETKMCECRTVKVTAFVTGAQVGGVGAYYMGFMVNPYAIASDDDLIIFTDGTALTAGTWPAAGAAYPAGWNGEAAAVSWVDTDLSGDIVAAIPVSAKVEVINATEELNDTSRVVAHVSPLVDDDSVFRQTYQGGGAGPALGVYTVAPNEPWTEVIPKQQHFVLPWTAPDLDEHHNRFKVWGPNTAFSGIIAAGCQSAIGIGWTVTVTVRFALIGEAPFVPNPVPLRRLDGVGAAARAAADKRAAESVYASTADKDVVTLEERWTSKWGRYAWEFYKTAKDGASVLSELAAIL